MIRNLWGPEDLASYLKVPVATVYQWRHKGYGPCARKIGRHLRYRPDDVEAWVVGLEA
ncbi:helix-turn-helix transcriptional regulator [Saccharopolyspora hattusasensis]|uniref:helix-turn-helix transcriptional regulator n=1 Tax=Saccharopolyspora hattusasensis TaxID=1128679 RepID=UPI003D99DD02